MPLSPEIIEQFRDALQKYVEKEGRGAQKRIALNYDCSEAYISALITGSKTVRSRRTQKKIAHAAGYKYEDFLRLGRKPRSEKNRPIEQNLVVDVINGFEKINLEERADHYRGVPLYESGQLAASIGGYTIDEDESPDSTVVIYRPELQGRAKHDLRALRIGGDSMWPVIPKGAIVVIDLNDREFVEHKIYAVREPDSDPPIATVKRVRKADQSQFNGFALLSENRKYLPWMVKDDWPDLVIGRVVWMWRSLEDA